MEFSLETILTVFSSLFATGLIGVGVWWSTQSLWPYIAARDEQERERRYVLAQASTTTQEAIALSMTSLAQSLNNPISVVIVEDA